MQGNELASEKTRLVMEIEIKQLGDRGVEIMPCGTLSAETVGELRHVLLDAPDPRAKVLLNLSDVDQIDAAGMALVMMARVELEASGIRFVVESSNPRLTRALMAAGLPRFVTLAPRRLDALRALGEEADPDAITTELGLDRVLALDA